MTADWRLTLCCSRNKQKYQDLNICGAAIFHTVTMIDVKTKIYSFFIFNSSFGPREGDVSIKQIV